MNDSQQLYLVLQGLCMNGKTCWMFWCNLKYLFNFWLFSFCFFAKSVSYRYINIGCCIYGSVCKAVHSGRYINKHIIRYKQKTWLLIKGWHDCCGVCWLKFKFAQGRDKQKILFTIWFKKTTCSMTKGVCLSQNTSKLLQTNQFAIEQM